MKTIKQISSGLKDVSGFWIFIRNFKLNPISGGSAAKVILLFMIFLMNTYLVPGGSPVMTGEMKYQADRALFYYQIMYEPFREDLLIKCLEYEGVLSPEIAILQSRLETGYFKSDIFLNANNLFGMRYARRRPTVATGIYKEHAKYAHWSDSVVDYALWQKYYMSRGYKLEDGIDSDFYLVFLRSIPYAEDPRYVSKLVTMSQGDLT